jgi:hypothetical protein
VIQAETLLADEGPALLLPVRHDAEGAFVQLFTGRSRLPAGTTDEDITSLPFATVLRAIEPMRIMLDVGTSCELVVPARHIGVLREVLRPGTATG